MTQPTPTITHQAFQGIARINRGRFGEGTRPEPLADFIERRRRVRDEPSSRLMIELGALDAIAGRVVAAQAAALAAGTGWAPAPVLSAADARGLLAVTALDEADLDHVIRVLTEAGVLSR